MKMHNQWRWTAIRLLTAHRDITAHGFNMKQLPNPSMYWINGILDGYKVASIWKGGEVKDANGYLLSDADTKAVDAALFEMLRDRMDQINNFLTD